MENLAAFFQSLMLAAAVAHVQNATKLIRQIVVSTFNKCGLTYTDEDTDDTVSDIVAKLLDGGLASFDAAKGSINTFIGIVARNYAFDAAKSTRYTVSLDEPTGEGRNHYTDGTPTDDERIFTGNEYHSHFPSPERVAIANEASKRIKAFLSTLPARDRDIYLSVTRDDSEETALLLAATYGLDEGAVTSDNHHKSEAWAKCRNVRRIASKVRGMVMEIGAE